MVCMHVCVLHVCPAALPEMLASRLLPEQVDQEAAWKAAMPGGLQQLVTEPRLCLEYANNLVRGMGDRVLLRGDVGGMATCKPTPFFQQLSWHQ